MLTADVVLNILETPEVEISHPAVAQQSVNWFHGAGGEANILDSPLPTKI